MTWRTKTVPASNDVVTVAGDDHVVVALTDPERIACRELHIDPRGMLSFKRGLGRVVLNVGGLIDCYGGLRLDMRHAEQDSAELRLAGTNAADRVLRLFRGGSLVMGGRHDLLADRRNVLLVSGPVPVTNAPAGDPTGQLHAQDGSSIDLLRAEVRDVQVQTQGLDNTGASSGERINVAGCRFTGRARLYLYNCDTPVVADNEFTCDTSPGNAIFVHGGALAEIRGNIVRGPYADGIYTYSADAIVISNIVEGASTGFRAHYPNLMLKYHVSRNCRVGYHYINSVTGVAEDCVADACRTSFYAQNIKNLQWVNCRAINVASNAVALNLQNTEISLLNCQISTNRVQLPRPYPKGQSLDTWNYLVVHVQGKVPAGSQVAVVTAQPAKPVPPGALDPNVRGSPAAIGTDGWTPLPASRAALVVRSWNLNHRHQVRPAPAYLLRVLGPAPKPDAAPPVLKQLRIQPGDDWYRPDPNARKATLEVMVP